MIYNIVRVYRVYTGGGGWVGGGGVGGGGGCKSFGIVNIDIECKNISISGGYIVYQIVRIQENENVLF